MANVKVNDYPELMALIIKIKKLQEYILEEYKKEEPDYIKVINPAQAQIHKLSSINLLEFIEPVKYG